MLAASLQRRRPSGFLRLALKTFAVLVCVSLVALALTFMLLPTMAGSVPITMTRHVLTNGEKVIIFQEMTHIADPSFYAAVHEEITQARALGFIVFYEGVSAAGLTPVDLARVKTQLGRPFNLDSTATITSIQQATAELSGLALYTNEAIGILESTDVNADISALVLGEAMNDIPSVMGTSRQFSEVDFRQLLAASQTMPSWLKRRVKAVIMIILHYQVQQGFEQFIPPALRTILLEQRNVHLTKILLSSHVSHQYVVYGQAHYQGMLPLLKNEDPRWMELGQTERQAMSF